MSELKAFDSVRIYWAVEQVEREFGDIDRFHLDDNWFYLKSEADKVIAELEESHKKEVGQLLIEIAGLKEHVKGLILDNYLKDKEIRRQKYKRCLTMARICYMKSWDCLQYISPREKYDHWKKWQTRWTELADKFKE